MTESSTGNENRHFSRVPFVISAHISSAEQNWECRLMDISLKGLLIDTPNDFDMNNDTLYAISLSLSEDVSINMYAKIIHSEAQHIGLQWVDIDLDSLTALRTLLELNLSDPEEIHRELAQLMSTKV